MKKIFLMLMAFSLVYVLAAPSSTFAGGGSNCVTLYSKANFKGEHIRVCGDRKDLSKIGWNDKTRSMKTEDITVYLYFDKNYKKYYAKGLPHTWYQHVQAGVSSLRFNTIEA
ncbi:beta/gamma crystallin-related protein [Shimazuella sp. AN120528]|uniref:beta/gamma crystallin-related protein n=1 Tax=Shimazuella soli TaxID=1892854 RepID=UPI001F1108E9|nr:beta/gamma crystallin-related protein [Shimazuella soli]MCH5584366.1 beta/gamma crystallin-related protein [Shimazuella soli]